MSENNYILSSEGELYHYGVKGQKWGVRRYQNADGTMTAEGRRRARKEVRDDNKTAFELGRDASVTGRAMGYSLARSVKIQNKLDKQFEKDPEGVQARTKKLTGKWMASTETARELAQMYAMQREKAETHCKSLIDKYGQEAVSPIKYKDVKMPKGDGAPNTLKVMNERSNDLNTYARAGAHSVLSSVVFSTLMGCPISVLVTPRSTANKGYIIERDMYRAKSKRYKNANIVYDLPND